MFGQIPGSPFVVSWKRPMVSLFLVNPPVNEKISQLGKFGKSSTQQNCRKVGDLLLVPRKVMI